MAHEHQARIGTGSLMLLTQQLSVLCAAGIHLVRALEVVGQNAHGASARKILERVATTVSQGATLSRALQQYPRAFPRVYVAMIRVGEQTGGLTEVLDRLQRWLERDARLQRRLIGSLTYPAFALLTAVVLTLLLFGVVLPPTMDLLTSLSPRLPWFAHLLLLVSQAVRNPLAWLLALVALVNLVLVLQGRWRDPVGRQQLSALLNAVPVLGPTLRIAGLARECSAVALMADVGVRLDVALALGAEASGNPLLVEDSARLVAGLKDGEDLPEQMARRPELYPGSMVHMVAVALETSTFGPAFGRLGRWYDEELAYRLELLQALVEPLLLAGVSMLVATVLMATVLTLQGVIGQLA